MTDARREPVSEWVDPKEWESREGYAEARAMWCRLKGYPDDFPVTLQCEYRPIDKLRQELVQRDAAQREQIRALADRLAVSEEKADAAQAWVNYTRKERDELKQRLEEVGWERDEWEAKCRDKWDANTLLRRELAKLQESFNGEVEASIQLEQQLTDAQATIGRLGVERDEARTARNTAMLSADIRKNNLDKAEQQVARLREAVVALLKTTERWIAGRFAGDTDDFKAARQQAEQALRETGASGGV